MENFRLNFLIALAVLLFSFACEGSAENARALFVFGDSYADTGNRDPYNASDNAPWRRPYGLDWPGYPTGRFSSGKIQTDYWAEILGLPTPIAYQMLKTHDCEEIPGKIIYGINFAVGGSGILKDYGYTTISDQVNQFKNIMNKTRVFGAQELARSVVLLSNAGSDYFSFLDNNSSDLTGLMSLVPSVVNGMGEIVKELYDFGFRNFVVSNVGDLGCVPEEDRNSCNSTYDDFIELHGDLLNESVYKLRSGLKGSNIIIPDFRSAIAHILFNVAVYGFEDWFKPCCEIDSKALGCAEVDERGDKLFDMCENPDRSFFWDNRHPTHRGWNLVMSLYAYGSANETSGKELSFVKGASNLMEWVKSIGFVAHNMSSSNSSIGNDDFVG